MSAWSTGSLPRTGTLVDPSGEVLEEMADIQSLVASHFQQLADRDSK